jgi:hypothetical protein
MPIAVVEGSRPMPTVATVIITRQASRIGLRPTRSPTEARSSPPRGRATKPAQKVANDSRTPSVAPAPGKNSGPKTSAAAVP